MKAGQHVYLCQASNISTEGILIANVFNDHLPLRGKCWLEFSLPGSNVLIAARGEVRRQYNYGRYLLNAVRFAVIAPSHRRLIGRYVEGPPVAASSPAFLPYHRCS